MSVPGPPPGWSPQGPPYPGPPPVTQPSYGPPPAPPGHRSGPPVALIVIAVLIVLVGGGGGAYAATISSGAYPRIVWSCTLVSPADATLLVPHGLPKGSPPGPGATESSCVWSNLLAENVQLEHQGMNLTLRVRRAGRDLLSSAETNAHKELVAQTSGSAVRSAGSPISGYGDEAVRVPRAFGGHFDAIVFRASNLVVEVAMEASGTPDDRTALAYRLTQQAASRADQRLRSLR
ncbi:MAG: hypothetical protein ACRDP6_20575 [Actinoallomurus sp.]